MNNSKNCWTVYCHTTPSGKRYIGITSDKPENRWKNGKGYHKDKPFGCAIEKYGWENIKHEILDTNLDEFTAKCLDEYYIFSYRTYIGFSDCNGYNCTLGGDGTIGRPAWNKGLPSQLKGIPKSDETKRRMSEAQKGKHPSEDTRRRISESNKGQIPWNKGKTGVQLSWNKGKTGLQVAHNKGKKLVMIDGKRHYE